MRISYWSSDVCSSDLRLARRSRRAGSTCRKAAVSSGSAADDARVPDRAPARLERGRLERRPADRGHQQRRRSEEHTSELQSLMRISYAVICLQKKNNKQKLHIHHQQTPTKTVLTLNTRQH